MINLYIPEPTRMDLLDQVEREVERAAQVAARNRQRLDVATLFKTLRLREELREVQA